MSHIKLLLELYRFKIYLKNRIMIYLSDGGFLERTLEGPFSPGLAGRVLSYADEEPPSPTTNELYDTPPYSASHSPTSQMVEEGLVTIILHPDEDGKYGFNVKGWFHVLYLV